MKQISNEAKARYFGMYLGCEINTPKGETKLLTISYYDGTGRTRIETYNGYYYEVDPASMSNDNLKKCSLLLRPLSSLTNEEAIQVTKIAGYDDMIPYEGGCGAVPVACYQYIQQIGIALPFYYAGENYTVEDLVEAGVVKLI